MTKKYGEHKFDKYIAVATDKEALEQGYRYTTESGYYETHHLSIKDAREEVNVYGESQFTLVANFKSKKKATPATQARPAAKAAVKVAVPKGPKVAQNTHPGTWGGTPQSAWPFPTGIVTPKPKKVYQHIMVSGVKVEFDESIEIDFYNKNAVRLVAKK